MERIFSKLLKWGLAVLLIVVLAACGGESITNLPTPDPARPSPEPTEPDGTYTDPGTPPPAPIAEPTVMTSASVAVSDKKEGLITLNIAGFDAEGSAALFSTSSAETLEAKDFTVVEDGVVQGIVVKPLSAGDKLATDIVFVIDTTWTMKDALESVQNSVIAFAGLLGSSGLDARLGAVTFGDAFDTLAQNSNRSGVSIQDKTPPSEVDREERPSFELTSDYLSFQTFIAEDSPREGRDDTENSLGALAFAHRRLAWREGAQRILVVITDNCSHTEVSNFFITEPWAPERYEDVLEELRSKATVHVIGSGRLCENFGTINMAAFTGVGGTGGMFHAWEGGDFDLADLGLTQAIQNSYAISYKGSLDGEEKDIRLVIDNGSTLKGELSLETSY